MKNVKFDKLYEKGYADMGKFMKLSEYIVKHYVRNTTEANKVVIAECQAIDMAMGAEFKKPEHILVGILIGVTITTLFFKLKESKDA